MTSENGIKVTLQQLLDAKMDHEDRLRNLEKENHQMSVHLNELPKISKKLDDLEKKQGGIRLSQISMSARIAGAAFALSILGTLAYIATHIGL